MLRVVTKKDATTLVNELRDSGYIITGVDEHGPDGKVRIIIMVLDRKKLDKVKRIVVEKCS